jgi:hypothetical protein
LGRKGPRLQYGATLALAFPFLGIGFGALLGLGTLSASLFAGKMAYDGTECSLREGEYSLGTGEYTTSDVSCEVLGSNFLICSCIGTPAAPILFRHTLSRAALRARWWGNKKQGRGGRVAFRSRRPIWLRQGEGGGESAQSTWQSGGCCTWRTTPRVFL